MQMQNRRVSTLPKDVNSVARKRNSNFSEKKDSKCETERTDRKDASKTPVTNVSTVSLTTAQVQLLEKCLNFIPSKNKIDKVKLLADVGEWEIRTRLREYFFVSENIKEKEKDEILSKGPDMI